MKPWVTVALAAATFAAAGEARAQQMGFASGEVVDEKGAPVADATVHFRFLGDQEREYETKTNKKGQFTQGLVSGSYRVIVSKEGYQGTYLDHRISSGSPTEVPTLTIVSRETYIQEAMAPIVKEFEKAADLSKAGQLDEAAAVYKKLEAEHPEMPEVHFNLGTVYIRQEKWSEAEAVLRKAVELKPEDTRARVLLATVHEQQGRTDEAQAEFERLAAENPDDAQLGYQLGVLHLNERRYEEAFEALDAVRESDPSNVDALYLLGTVSLNLGKTDLARTHLQSYLEKAPADGRYRTLATELLGQLDKPAQ